MQSAATREGFNRPTVDWFGPSVRLAAGRAAAWQADPEAIAAFRRDGAALVPAAFVDWVEPLRAGLERNLAAPERFAFPAESTRAGAPGRFFDSYCNWQRIPAYRDYLERSCAAAMADGGPLREDWFPVLWRRGAGPTT